MISITHWQILFQEWNSDKLPVYEPGLDDVIRECRGRNLVIFHFISNAMESITIKAAQASAKVNFSGPCENTLWQSLKIATSPKPNLTLADKFSTPYHKPAKDSSILSLP